MNRRFNFILIVLALSTCFYYKAGAQNIQAQATIDLSTIRIGDQTKLHLIVHQPAKAHVNFPQLTDTLTGKVLIIGAAKTDTVFDKKDHNLATVTQSYTITAFDAGTYKIPSFAFGSGAGVVKTDSLTLQVQTVQVDTTKAIFDIKQPMAVSYTFFDWLRDHWAWVAIPLVVVLLIIGLIWYLRKRPKKVPVVQEVSVYVAPHTEALSKLEELRDKKLWQQGEIKAYHSELSDIIREYMERRYAIKTHEKTTDEIFSGLKYLDITQENKNLLSRILRLADLVKFAKEKPLPPENEQSMDNAISFVMKTLQVPQAPINAEGGGANEPV